MPSERGEVQRLDVLLIAGVDGRAPLQERPHERRVPALRRDVDRLRALVVRGLQVRRPKPLEQEGHDLDKHGERASVSRKP